MKGHELYKHFPQNFGERKPWVTLIIYIQLLLLLLSLGIQEISLSLFLSVFTRHSSRILHAYYFVNKTSVVFITNIIIF